MKRYPSQCPVFELKARRAKLDFYKLEQGQHVEAVWVEPEESTFIGVRADGEREEVAPGACGGVHFWALPENLRPLTPAAREMLEIARSRRRWRRLHPDCGNYCTQNHATGGAA